MSTPPLPPSGDPDRPDADPASPPAAHRWSGDDNAWVSGPLTPSLDEPAPRVGSRPWVHLLLLVLTFLAMTRAGADFFLNYVSAVGLRPVRVSAATALLGGLWFSIPALLILGTHELGHYVACRYYRIPASLPYFVPGWIPLLGHTLIGTFGAVIRMAVPRTKRALFDVGIAGPIAGFLVLIPFAVYGVSHSYVVHLPRVVASQGAVNLGDPLLLTWLQSLIFGALPPRSVFVMHPMGFAAWFGLIATSLNLFPAGQLDGGHIVHAVFGKASRLVTVATVVTLLVLGATVSGTWLFWGGLLTAMVFLVGLDHPPVIDEHLPIGGARIALAIFAVAMFVLSFTPVPLSPAEFLGR